MSPLGRRFRYTVKDGPVAEGVCIATRRPGSTILDPKTGQEWPAVQFRLRLDEGRTIWTVSYPDREP